MQFLPCFYPYCLYVLVCSCHFASSLGTQSWLLIIKLLRLQTIQADFTAVLSEGNLSLRSKTTEKALCFYENHVATRKAITDFFKLFFPVLHFKGREREKNVFIFETTKFSNGHSCMFNAV